MQSVFVIIAKSFIGPQTLFKIMKSFLVTSLAAMVIKPWMSSLALQDGFWLITFLIEELYSCQLRGGTLVRDFAVFFWKLWLSDASETSHTLSEARRGK